MSGTKKYRPSLTMTQITTLIELCKNQQPMSPNIMDVLSVLAPYYTKIQLGTVQPNHTVSNKPKTPADLLTELGCNDSTGESYISTNMSKAHYWEQCYNKLLTNGPDLLTAEELAGAQEHRYLNNLMTPEEVAEFDAGVIIPPNNINK